MTEEQKKAKAAEEAAAEKAAAAAAAKKAKAPAVKAGTKINLVHANGGHVPATVTAVRDGHLVDLRTEGGLVITSSPLDPTGKQPDSWHYATGPNSDDEAAE